MKMFRHRHEVDSALVERAYKYLRNGDYSKADNLFRWVLDSKPSDVNALLGRLMCERSKMVEEDLQHCEKPLNHSPYYSEIMKNGNEDVCKRLKEYNTVILRRYEKKIQMLDEQNKAYLMKRDAIELEIASGKTDRRIKKYERSLKRHERKQRLFNMFERLCSFVCKLFVWIILPVAAFACAQKVVGESDTINLLEVLQELKKNHFFELTLFVCGIITSIIHQKNENNEEDKDFGRLSRRINGAEVLLLWPAMGALDSGAFFIVYAVQTASFQNDPFNSLLYILLFSIVSAVLAIIINAIIRLILIIPFWIIMPKSKPFDQDTSSDARDPTARLRDLNVKLSSNHHLIADINKEIQEMQRSIYQ